MHEPSNRWPNRGLWFHLVEYFRPDEFYVLNEGLDIIVSPVRLGNLTASAKVKGARADIMFELHLCMFEVKGGSPLQGRRTGERHDDSE
jgi:hypothetical protein